MFHRVVIVHDNLCLLFDMFGVCRDDDDEDTIRLKNSNR